jgi:hypothetical protein
VAVVNLVTCVVTPPIYDVARRPTSHLFVGQGVPDQDAEYNSPTGTNIILQLFK